MAADVLAFAPAKINLTLHVTGRRADGYHLLDSLVVFANIGDEIAVTAAPELSLRVSGPMAEGVPEDGSNLVLKAAELIRNDADRGAAITLSKKLPPASGIGGGSSDAAATLRALAMLWDMPLPTLAEVLGLGADLPVCMEPIPQRMSGIGDIIAPVPNVPEVPIVLVNPRLHVPTPQIFKALEKRDNAPMAGALPSWKNQAEFITWLKAQRNDLQAPAILAAPPIADCLAALESQNACQLARMSGSGATGFGIFETDADAQAAATRLSAEHPDWWIAAGRAGSAA